MLRFLINSNIFVGFSITTLYIYYAAVLKTNIFLSTPLLIFGSTFLAYNFLRVIALYGTKALSCPLSIWYKKNKMIMALLALISFIFCIHGLFDLNSIQISILLSSGVLVLFYERIFVPAFSLRYLPYTKPIIISICWSLLTVGMHFTSLSFEFFIALFDCFFFITLLCLLFDFKDSDMDKLESIKSITHLKNDKLSVFFVLLHCTAYLAFLFYFFDFSNPLFYALGFLILISISLKSLKHPIIFSLITDGIILYKALLGIYLLQN